MTERSTSSRRRARDRLATVSINLAGAAVLGLIALMLVFLIHVSLPLAEGMRVGEARALDLPASGRHVLSPIDARLWQLPLPASASGPSRARRAQADLALELFDEALFVYALSGAAAPDAVRRARLLGALAAPGIDPATLSLDSAGDSVLIAYHAHNAARQAAQNLEKTAEEQAEKSLRLQVLAFDRRAIAASLRRWSRPAPEAIAVEGVVAERVASEVEAAGVAAQVPAATLLLDASLRRVLALRGDRYLLWQLPDARVRPGSGAAAQLPSAAGRRDRAYSGRLADLSAAAGPAAWGPGRETLLVVNGAELHRFDVQRPGLPRLGPPQVLPLAPVWLHSERKRRLTYALDAAHTLLALVPSTGQIIYRGRLQARDSDPGAGHAAPERGRFFLSAEGRYLSRLHGARLTRWPVHSGSPETRWRSLWTAQWFGAYDRPTHTWHPDGAAIGVLSKYGLNPLLYGTFKAALYGMLIALPLALGAAIYTGYFLAPRQRDLVKPALELLEAFPTVVLGFIAGLWLAPRLLDYLAAVLLLPLLMVALPLLLSALYRALPRLAPRLPPRAWLLGAAYILLGGALLANAQRLELWLFQGDTGAWLWQRLGLHYAQRNGLLVGLAMGIAITPLMFSLIEDAIHAVPRSLSDGSLALGATRWQSLGRVVLPAASPAVLSAVLIGFARGLGETMIVLLATGNTPLMQADPFSGLRSLSASIAVELPEAPVGGVHFRLLFVAALILFLLTFVMNTLAEVFRQRLRYAYAPR